MSRLIDIYETVKTCEYRGETYSVRDNGAIMRHARDGKNLRPNDNHWTLGTISADKGYFMFGREAVHRIVATAFLG